MHLMTETPRVASPAFASTFAVVPVADASSPQVPSLDTALANMAKLDAALESARRASTLSRCGPLERYALKSPAAAAFLTFAAPVAAVGGMACLWSDLLLAFGTLFSGVVSYCAGAEVYERLEGKRNGATEPALNSSELGPALTLLHEMPAEERAWIAAYAKRELDRNVEQGRLTVGAGDAMRQALTAGTDDLAREVRAGKAALCLRDARERSNAVSNLEWSTLLATYDGTERQEIASMLLAALFKDERCTLHITDSLGNSLYSMLREAQKNAD